MKKLFLFLLSSFLLVSPSWATNWCAESSAKGCWIFAEGTGTIVDDSTSNNHDGDFASSGHPAWYNSILPKSYINWAVDFTPNDYIVVQDHADFDVGTALTLTSWVRVDSANGTKQIMFKYGLGENKQIAIRDGKVGVYLYGTGVSLLNSSASSISADTWYHVSTIYNGTTLKIYIDGVEDGTQNYSADINDGAGLVNFGIGTSLAEPMDGKLAELSWFNSALTPTNINDIMDNGLVQAAGNPISQTIQFQGVSMQGVSVK